MLAVGPVPVMKRWKMSGHIKRRCRRHCGRAEGDRVVSGREYVSQCLRGWLRGCLRRCLCRRVSGWWYFPCGTTAEMCGCTSSPHTGDPLVKLDVVVFTCTLTQRDIVSTFQSYGKTKNRA